MTESDTTRTKQQMVVEENTSAMWCQVSYSIRHVSRIVELEFKWERDI